MKHVIMIAALVVMWSVLPLVACKPVTAPLPAWAPNASVAVVATFIDGAHKTVTGYEQDQADCAATPTLTKCPGVTNAAIHAAVSDIQKALTIAQPEFNQWEAAVRVNPNATEPADLAAAISTIETTLAQLPTLTK